MQNKNEEDRTSHQCPAPDMVLRHPVSLYTHGLPHLPSSQVDRQLIQHICHCNKLQNELHIFNFKIFYKKSRFHNIKICLTFHITNYKIKNTYMSYNSTAATAIWIFRYVKLFVFLNQLRKSNMVKSKYIGSSYSYTKSILVLHPPKDSRCLSSIVFAKEMPSTRYFGSIVLISLMARFLYDLIADAVT